MSPSVEILQGTLDLLILKTLALEPMHGWGIAQRIQQSLARSPANPARFALPGAVSPGTQEMDPRGMGRLRK